MSNKSVTVLAPNGRRQNVKVTPNTTILQVLEEVCKKQGFKAEEYDITHHNKALDATSIMRYTGLPNNAQLEMAAARKTRAESRVKVGLALESGDRVMGEFDPSDSLWHVVKTLCPDEAEADELADILPVIFYLGREECGTENLERTTLRSLGLTSGGAILRFFKKTPEELHHQANVSAPLSKPAVPTSSTQSSLVNISSDNMEKAKQSETDELASTSQKIPEQSLQSDIESIEKFEANQSQTTAEESVSIVNSANRETACPSVSQSTGSRRSESETLEMDYEDSSTTTQPSSGQSSSSLPLIEKESQEAGPSIEPEETIVFLGERNAILFDVATARACQPDDVPDDFFDLTMDDAKQLLRDIKQRKAALEEQPLVTSQYRELEKSKQMLNALHQYKRCVIKVQFPNQLVLQGIFTPLEKISHVVEFVRKYLQDPTIDFHLFITPPKQLLEPAETLYDANCVPGALVHFMSSAPCPENGSYICETVMAQVSSLSAATTAAAAVRMSKTVSLCSSQVTQSGPSTSQVLPSSSAGAPTSVSKPSSSSKKASSSSEASEKKVPRWFKPVNK